MLVFGILDSAFLSEMCTTVEMYYKYKLLFEHVIILTIILFSFSSSTDVKDIEQPEELFKEIESITLESDKNTESSIPKTNT